jgi:predicted flap endonuclease-1-like 5' DNA nuclease
MPNPVCSLWWLLAALLSGWLLCGWFARQYLPRVGGGSADAEREIHRLQAELARLRAAALIDTPRQEPAATRAEVPLAAAAPLSSDADNAQAHIDAAATRAASAGPDDLQVIEGVGPKIAAIFQAAGIDSFARIAAMTPADIQPLLDAAGPNFRIADPQTWPDQAALAAARRWAELKVLQDSLTGGRKV